MVDASATTRYGETVGDADEGESILQGRAAMQIERERGGRQRGGTPDLQLLLKYKERVRLPVPNS
jgi:hypothetical protein